MNLSEMQNSSTKRDGAESEPPESAESLEPVQREDLTLLGRVFYVVKEIFIIIILFLLLRNLVVQARYIPSPSMHPGLLEGDRLLVELVTKHFNWIERGDILVFYRPDESWPNFKELLLSSFGLFDDHAMIKRVIGMPGDKVEVIPHVGVKVNDVLLDEPYIAEAPRDHYGPIIVPEDEYFMMGDNRNHSLDSRYWGTLPKDHIVGKATVRFFPFRRAGVIR